MILNIKNMVSASCRMIVKAEMEKLGLQYSSIELGLVNVDGIVSPKQFEQLRMALLKVGLELIEDKKTILVEKIKHTVLNMVHYSDEPLKIKNSKFISSQLNHNYTYLANIFSATTGTSIEHYIIYHKIERVKELMRYNELNLSEIAWKLHYSSVAHLSNQFKKVTGLTPSLFKSQKSCMRNMLENVCA
jgi:AraC-like DNA-binding protein